MQLKVDGQVEAPPDNRTYARGYNELGKCCREGYKYLYLPHLCMEEERLPKSMMPNGASRQHRPAGMVARADIFIYAPLTTAGTRGVRYYTCSHYSLINHEIPVFFAPRPSCPVLSSPPAPSQSPTAEWQASLPHTRVRSTPCLEPLHHKAQSLTHISHRPRPHRRNRRHRDPSPPRLHTRCNPQPNNTMGHALLADIHPAPPVPLHGKTHPNSIHLAPRPAPRARPA